MNKKIIALAIALCLNALSLPANADRPKVVKGKPCAKEFCIGDDLTTLNINWQPVNLRSSRIKLQKGTMLGNPQAIQAFYPYWNNQAIDRKGLAALSKISGFCDPNPGSLQGQYTDSFGRPVIVNFLLIATDNGKKQKFVANRVRIILLETVNITQEQTANIEAQLKSQYPGLVGFNLEDKPHVSLEGVLYDGNFRQAINLWGESLIPLRNAEVFRRYPGCGGDRIIKIN